MLFKSNVIARTNMTLGVAASFCILSGCSVLSTLHHDKQLPTAQAPAASHVEVGGLVREPGVVHTEEESITIERAILRAGGPIHGASDSDYDLLVAVRQRDYKPAITTYYSLPSVLRGPVGQVRVSDDDVVTLVHQSDTVFGRPQTDQLAELAKQQQVLRLGSRDAGRNVTIGEIVGDFERQPSASGAIKYLKARYGQLSPKADVFVVTRQNWGGIGIARGVFPINEPRRISAPIVQASTQASSLPAPATTVTDRRSQLDRFIENAPETGPESEFVSSRVENSIRLEDAATVRGELRLADRPQVTQANPASGDTNLTPTTTAGSTASKKTETFRSLDTIRLLGGDQITVAQSGLLSEVLTSALRPALERRVEAASETLHEKMAGRRSENSVVRRAVEPIERVKKQLVGRFSRVFP